MDQTINIYPLATGWRARPQAEVSVDGTVLTSSSYTVEGWLDAVVPGSVLATLVKNKKVLYPYFGDNSKPIPDIGKVGVGLYTYWFYNAFTVPAPGPGRRVELRFDGINYAATVYLNSRKLGDTVGMFHRHVFDITSLVIAGENQLAVLVTPPNPPGVTNGNGGKSDQPNIGESVVARYPVGWDWVIPMPDRSTGIWDGVSVYFSGPVVIGDPHVVTRVPGVRVPSGAQGPAYLTVTASITNTSGTRVSGVLSCEVDGKTDRKSVTLNAGETQAVKFDRQIDNPRLWWPNGLGQPELYPVTLTFTIGTAESDRRSFRAGLRQIEVSTINVSGRQTRAFHVNGRQIFLRGGNWIGTDAMFRYSTDAKRYRDEVRMHADANLNLIRVWGGGIAERDPFYQACDEYGIMVMQDFWISGEYNGPFSDTWTNVFQASAQDTIKRLQHHPSLLFWTGGNEQTPPDPINSALKGWVEGSPGSGVLDGTRIYVDRSTNISGSSSDQFEDGPYGILDPAEFFRNPSSNPVNPELGSVGIPTFESLRLFMPETALAQFPAPGQPSDEVGAVWQHHDYIPYFFDANNPVLSDQTLFKLQNVPTTPNMVYFVDLHLSNQRGEIVSKNFYWLTTGDYQSLRNLAPAKIDATGTLTRPGERWEATVMLTNPPGQPVAFWIRLQVLTSKTMKRVLPVFYADNYISLVPGEQREIHIDFAATDVPPGEAPEIWIERWNVPRSRVTLQ